MRKWFGRYGCNGWLNVRAHQIGRGLHREGFSYSPVLKTRVFSLMMYFLRGFQRHSLQCSRFMFHLCGICILLHCDLTAFSAHSHADILMFRMHAVET